MVLMSGKNTAVRTENFNPENSKSDSLSSDSGISSCSKEGSLSDSSHHREKSKSHPIKEEDLEDTRGSSSKKSSRRKHSGSDHSDSFSHSDFFGDDPFFADKASRFFNKSRHANKPRLKERIFGKGRSVFDNDKFVDDLRKKIQEEKKMFFDGGSDPFASTFGGRPASPVGGGNGRTFEDLRNGARARFDEFANRHPMFSTMRNQPTWDFDDPFGHHGFSRERHSSGSSGVGSGASNASTGEERVIPIQIIRDDPPKAPQPQQTPPQAPPRGKSPSPQNVNVAAPRDEKMSQPHTNTGPQRCNTEPNNPNLLEENRAARAQSAPPVSQNGIGMKVESNGINEGKPQATQIGGNCSKNSKPEQPPPPSSNNGGGVRSIPIIVEGRKTPVVNSMPNGNCQNQAPSQPKVSRPAERSPTPPPKKPAPPKDPLAQVNAVLEEVKELEKQVDEFTGNSREDRGYLVLDEMLTRCLIKLDVVETEGRDDVRTARKDCIRYIQGCISKLEKKAPLQTEEDKCNGEQPMELGSQSQTQGETDSDIKMDIASQESSTGAEKSQFGDGTTNNNDQKMDSDTSPSSKVEPEPQPGGGGDQPVKA